MPLSDVAANMVLDEIFNAGTGLATFTTDPYLQLHNGDPGANGTTNIVDTPRQQFAAPAASSRTLENSAIISFPTMPAVTTPGVIAWSVWDTADATPLTPGGVCGWTGWFKTVEFPFSVESVDLANNDITVGNHGFVADDRVVFEAQGSGLALPTGITAGTLYFVLATGLATDTFRFATTSGGAAIDVTATGAGGVVHKVPPNPVLVGNTFQVAAGALDWFA